MSEIYETTASTEFVDGDGDGEFDTATRGTGGALAAANPYASPADGDTLYDVPSTS